ncbi:MAG: asparaginase [candidate division Zixibacteria bacterium]|nr:asparaginase [candidate division Zixibacteria bacterium]
MTEILAEVYRNKTVESVHYGSIVVSDNKGDILYYCGDPDKITYTRSSAKAFQFISVYESGAIKKFGFDLRQIAVMLGSHNGSDLHQQVVKSNLELIGLDESYLKCGTHVPYELKLKGYVPYEGQTFSPLAHNCSGKHSGQLALALQLGDDPKDYIEPDSKTQRMVRESFSDFYDYPIDKMQMGIDGCSLPNYALPLKNMAKAYATLVTRNVKSTIRRQACETVIRAMSEHPLMVSGNMRADLAVAEACHGEVILKVGGEAVELIGILKRGLGVVIKIADGNSRAIGPVIVEVLRQLAVIDADQVKSLAPTARPQLYNQRKIRIGEIVPAFKLKRG